MQVIPYQSPETVLGVDLSKPRPTINSLPDELILLIFRALDPLEIYWANPRVCQRWKRISADCSLIRWPVPVAEWNRPKIEKWELKLGVSFGSAALSDLNDYNL